MPEVTRYDRFNQSYWTAIPEPCRPNSGTTHANYEEGCPEARSFKEEILKGIGLDAITLTEAQQAAEIFAGCDHCPLRLLHLAE